MNQEDLDKLEAKKWYSQYLKFDEVIDCIMDDTLDLIVGGITLKKDLFQYKAGEGFDSATIIVDELLIKFFDSYTNEVLRVQFYLNSDHFEVVPISGK